LERRRGAVSQRYKVVQSHTKEKTICFNLENIGKTAGRNRKIAYVRFGIKCCEVKIETSEKIKKGELLLSSEVIEALKIPLYLSYEIVFYRNNIIIGPYIGLLTEKKQEGLRKKVDNLKSYVYSYEEIGGAVLAFTEEGVDVGNHLICGFIYNPENGTWEEGCYPYPASIFKRTGIKMNLRNHFQSLLGDTIFNNYIFSKWEAHQWLNNFEGVRQYLPDTVLYEKSLDMGEVLKRHKSVYIKPTYGSQGDGIIKLDAKEDCFTVQYRPKGEKVEQSFQTFDELNIFLKNSLIDRKYIVQRSLELISAEERTIDIRLILVKGGDGHWHDLGLIARRGVKGEITNNVSTGGGTVAAEVIFKNVLNLSAEEVTELKNKIGYIGKRAAIGLEESGVSCGNLGIDIGIDAEGHIWIIEINNIDPNHTIAIDAKDRRMFYRARLLNMLYARRLAGFPEEI
jgi:glutathione synthase/RimK-type ligase-like ATP-grasp enzyme